MQEPSSPVNPPEVGIRVHKSSETGLPGEPFSLTSLWPSVSRCTSRSLASSTSCIWELRARPRESLWGAERSQLPLCGRVQDSAGLGWPSPPATSTQAWGARSRMCPQGGGVSGQLPWPRQQGDRGPESGRSGPGGPPRAGSSEHSPPSLSEQTISPMLGGMRRSARSGLPLPHAGQTWAHCAGSRGIQGWGRGRLGLGGSPRPAAAASPAVSAAPSPHRAAGPCGGGQCPSWKQWDGSGSTLLPCCWPGQSGPVFRAYPTARLTLPAVTDPCHPGNCHPSNSS